MSDRAREAYHEGTDYQFETAELSLGPWSSYSLINDPKHLCFVLARYKFCAKLLEGHETVVEIGCGDGIGLPIVAQSVGHVYVVDWDERLLEGNARRLSHLGNVEYVHADLNEAAPSIKADAGFSIDVLEHIDPERERSFVRNMVACLKPRGVLITGTPNATADQYATPRSRAQHINLKTMAELRELTSQYFEHVFMFGQNDEVIHTGYGPMCHYIWSLGVDVRADRPEEGP